MTLFLPGLVDRCQQDDTYCCICGENQCYVALSSRGETILFADGEEAIQSGPHCDCIIVLRRDKKGVIEIYAVELKGIQVSGTQLGKGRAIDPSVHSQKCNSCLKWAKNIVNQFNSHRKISMGIRKYCVIVFPDKILDKIRTLLERQKYRYSPRGADGGRIVHCGQSITSRASIIWGSRS